MVSRWTRTKVTDVEALKAVSHPLRTRLLGLLRLDGPATASELARRVGESSGSTSYHLRQLARYGFVVEDEQQPSRRERRWRAAAALTSWQDDDFVADPAGREASDALGEIQLQHAMRNNRRWRQERRSWPAAWRRAGGASDVQVHLTAAAAKRLTQEIFDLVQRYELESADDPKAQPVGVFYQLTPGRSVLTEEEGS
ncbi:MAG: helix-turn-helix domain-containing protein [Candidatus Nanopelagicales bacterium]